MIAESLNHLRAYSETVKSSIITELYKSLARVVPLLGFGLT